MNAAMMKLATSGIQGRLSAPRSLMNADRVIGRTVLYAHITRKE
jgi:hypothetical protein